MFVDLYQLKNLINEPTCFKSDNPKCIYLILTNRPFYFQSSGAIETGLSDFHSMIVTIFKGWLYQKGSQNGFSYRDYSKCDVNSFRLTLRESLTEVNRDDQGFSEFRGRVKVVLN